MDTFKKEGREEGILRIAIQTKGRLNEDSTELLIQSGVSVGDSSRKFLSRSETFPMEILYLRDDDIPGAVDSGAADIGIVGYNEVLEKGYDVEILEKLGFGGCRLSIAVPNGTGYEGPSSLEGKRIATSYPEILRRFLSDNGVNAGIETIAGSVEVAPAIGMADAIFDIVSSGGTLRKNGLKEVERVVESEAVLIGGKSLSPERKAALEQLRFRFRSVKGSRGKKYLLMNIPAEALEKAIEIVPAMRSPTILPLAQSGWYSLHSVVDSDVLWEKIERLKEIGAEGILVLGVEKLVL